MMSERTAQIKDVLERLYAMYNHKKFIPPDPLHFVYRYTNPADMRIAAFLSAVLAYGRVQQIEKSLTDLFGRMEDSPYQFVWDFDGRGRTKLKDFKHRFTSGDDIADLLELLQIVLDKYSNIEKFFIQGYNSSDENIIPALSKFCDSLLDMYAATHKGQIGRGLRYLLASPDRGSACKRLNLFLRWMVRDDDVDTGLWRSIDKTKLIVPMDVHMGRLCRILGFYNRKNISLKTALEATKGFAEIDPNDPVKYDFALSRIGILENCNGQRRKQCTNCELYEFCSELKGK